MFVVAQSSVISLIADLKYAIFFQCVCEKARAEVWEVLKVKHPKVNNPDRQLSSSCLQHEGNLPAPENCGLRLLVTCFSTESAFVLPVCRARLCVPACVAATRGCGRVWCGSGGLSGSLFSPSPLLHERPATLY